MKSLLFVSTLLLAAATFAQQSQPQGYPQPSPPQQMPGEQMPPDQAAPPNQAPEGQATMGSDSGAVSRAQVEQEIQQALQSQPALAKADVRAEAKGSSIVVKGTVADESQHQMAFRVAELHASGMRIIDRIKVQH